MQASRIRIGTRGSPLAIAQAHEVRDRLKAAHGWKDDEIAIVVIKTTGDQVLDRPLAEIGGKGLFTKELEHALFDDEIDIAVHSMKDMQTELPDGLTIGAVLEREDVRDAFVSLHYSGIDSLPEGATVGTSSLRRQSQLLHVRPDLNVINFRGNIQTRLNKLADGVADATFLAMAGLKRLGMIDKATAPITIEQMLPAVAQAAIGIEIRADDETTRRNISALNHSQTAIAVTAERAFLRRLEGSCRTPIGGYAELIDGQLHFRGQLLTTDGMRSYSARRTGDPANAEQLGISAADEILSNRDNVQIADTKH